MPIYKRCSRCGKRLLEGTKCSCIKERYKIYRKERTDTKEQRFYSSDEWETKREQVKQRYKGIDIYSYYVLGKTEFGRLVHHIKELKEDYSLRLDDDNLILLTDSNHQKIHNIMNRSEEDKKRIQKLLFDLVKRFREEITNNDNFI